MVASTQDTTDHEQSFHALDGIIGGYLDNGTGDEVRKELVSLI